MRSWQAVALRCLLADDSKEFLDAASVLLERGGVSVVGRASTGRDALVLAAELDPDVTVVDVDLQGESGFDVAWQLAGSDGPRTQTVLMSTHSEADFAELIAVTPVLGFLPKTSFSAAAIRDFVGDRNHGHGCRHEALFYSSPDELVAASVPFLRRGLAGGEHALVVLRDPGRLTLQEALGDDTARVEFRDAVPWYQSPEHSVESYRRYLGDHLGDGASRVRVVAEVVWPPSSAASETSGWKRYEVRISSLMASVPVSFVCTYDTCELPAEILAIAERAHPVLRTTDGAWPSSRYEDPGTLMRALDET